MRQTSWILLRVQTCLKIHVTILYTNIPHEDSVTTVCHANEDFYGDKAPMPTKYLREMLYHILTENSFQFCGSNYLQTHGATMGTKMAVAANIFMARIRKTKYWNRVVSNRFFGKDTLTMCFSYGTQV